MIALFISLYIISLFTHEAKRLGRNKFLWGFIGFISYWVPSFGLSYILERILNDPRETIEVIIMITGTISFLILGFWTSNKVKKFMIEQVETK